MIKYEFPNKVVLVTGSSRGIGAGVLSAFAKAGATCVLHFWDDPGGGNRKDADALAAKLRTAGVPVEMRDPTGSFIGQFHPRAKAVHVFAADVRDAEQIENLMKQVKAKCGG